ncbi:MAG: NAD(P)H-hydrate dehydratase [Bacillota bacterium]|jgi:hydroxyethylthiazole kinase-like uncharacterized protein yjeF
MMFLASSEEMRDIDRKAILAGIPVSILMENAGRALASHAFEMAAESREGAVVVLAGPGQNGGDGLSAARHLSSRGFGVKVVLFASPSRMTAEARLNLDALRAYPVEIFQVDDETGFQDMRARLGPVTVIVDALLGTGQKGPPRPPMDEAVKWACEAGVPVVACDIPTGVDADTGHVFDPVVRADVTVTMGVPKRGLYIYPGAKFAGRIVVEPLGLPPSLLGGPFQVSAATVQDAVKLMPRREADHHKGLSGHVLVIAGSTGMAGAAVLAAKAALRGGAGTVTLLCPREIYPVCAGMLPEVMVLSVSEGGSFSSGDGVMAVIGDFLSKSGSVVLGPGLGRGSRQEAFVKECVELIASKGVPSVIDADGLNNLSGSGGLSYLSSLEGKFILTPHPGELSRLLGVQTRDIERDRISAAREAASRGKSVVCLKGAGTCVANSVGSVTVNTTGDPAMATAGSGDVLAGVIASLVSQGLPLYEAAWLGVLWHGLAGETAVAKAGSYGVLAGEICDFLPEARKTLVGGE